MSHDPTDIFEQRLRTFVPSGPDDSLKDRVLKAAGEQSSSRVPLGWVVRVAAAVIVACLCLNAWVESRPVLNGSSSPVVADRMQPDPQLREFALSYGCSLPQGRVRCQDGLSIGQARDQLEALLKS
ncbi:MAG: hypothetical protein JXL80_07160 [Planctomycetes bacterium]|nr:hypothetical protein [Planctomycetota bacterium]